ncbi:hypothetical protein SBOR_5560 [Sclerotinia borealis F-4128]|uniref:Uncharacterized protein n=1 Tax=Sclerotinia borealis (strain F-4128) TaxID=1432307 RepID=W9CH08_SCLBF|nr:hypothetical protein SBOR_5560 [Sclerotinia borealis F-4128]
MSFQHNGLITTYALYSAYLQASKPELRETATVPLWEDILNNEFKQYDNIVVNSQQPLDDSTRSADVVVRSYDQEFKPISFLIMECKRYSRTHRDIDEMELQLELYVQNYFSEFGKSEGRTGVFGAVAFGTKIRAWRFTCETPTSFVAIPLMDGKTGIADLESYRDPYIPAEANQIREFLKMVRTSKLTSTSQISYTTESSSSTTNTNILHSTAIISTNTFSHSQEIIGPTQDHYYVFEQNYYWYSQGKITDIQDRLTNEWVYNYYGWAGEEANGCKWRMVYANKQVIYA